MSARAPSISKKAMRQEADAGARQVRLFRNGANQAVRIPKEFELPGKEAVLHREGNRLVIEPLPSKLVKGSAASLLTVLASMRPIGREFPDVDTGLMPLDDVSL